MRILDGLGVVNLPPSIRTRATDHFAKLILAENPHALLLVKVQAQGFVEGLELVQALNTATIEAMYLAIDHVASGRLKELLM
ncbi:hypothetical protein [Pseudomonas reactans]|uniref:hypothetical protein n=1 Tax=Pseudomonas reactans TaxID=117680 RepID=UPI0015A47C75|nr:hypothetical protein [Pseudomonas reactans]NWA67711.1 hypothetical protein [Pseudomonas reactans]